MYVYIHVTIVSIEEFLYNEYVKDGREKDGWKNLVVSFSGLNWNQGQRGTMWTNFLY